MFYSFNTCVVNAGLGLLDYLFLDLLDICDYLGVSICQYILSIYFDYFNFN